MLFYWQREVVLRIKCRGSNNCGTHGFVKNNYFLMDLILQRHAIPGGQHLIGANFLLQQDNDPKHTSKLCKKLFREEAVSWYSVCNGVDSAVTRSQPY